MKRYVIKRIKDGKYCCDYDKGVIWSKDIDRAFVYCNTRSRELIADWVNEGEIATEVEITEKQSTRKV
jgi:hypothetical protein